MIRYIAVALWVLAGVPLVAVSHSARAATTPDAACGDYLPHASATQRLQAGNRARLAAAQALLAPNFAARGAEDGLYLLADYQEELERVRPDRTAAAIYLAAASAVPVTLRLLQVLNATLCVAASPGAAQAIATQAEAARIEMSR